MGAPFFRPPRRRASQVTYGGHSWNMPFQFSDGRYFKIDEISLCLFENVKTESDDLTRMSCCYLSVIEQTAQCYFDIEVNFWPPVFETGFIDFNNVDAQFEGARREAYAYLATAHPQRGRSEFPWKIQLHYLENVVLLFAE